LVKEKYNHGNTVLSRASVIAVQMRIVAGQFGGRRLAMPKDARVRPTADRVREAWMSILGNELDGARVLDLYAGSGALGLEALSRGADSATFVELNPASLRALEQNIATLGVADAVTVHRADAMRFVERLPPGAFDVVLADPPYTADYAARLIAHFRRHPFGRILSVEHRSDVQLDGDSTRRYGDTALTFCHAP
jgi:16S rRNA (guanine966-N2)-methyltransferase